MVKKPTFALLFVRQMWFFISATDNYRNKLLLLC